MSRYEFPPLPTKVNTQQPSVAYYRGIHKVSQQVSITIDKY
ncbi:MAG: hypothetical protein NTY88_02620 [Bacteroidetes bacterium]|nr:hypothetical protein [Bacteroidota bacterium]